MASSKNTRTANKISIILGVLALVGTIIAAVIGILPDILSTAAQRAVKTPVVSFTKYDDPSGIFSIKYPSNYYVESRNFNYTRQAFLVVFQPLPDVKSEYRFTVFVGGSKNPNANSGKETVNENELMLQQLKDTLPNEEMRILINEKTDKGFYLEANFVKSDGSTTRSYFLTEFENEYYAYVMFFFDADLVETIDKDGIKNITSSFTWSSSTMRDVLSNTP